MIVSTDSKSATGYTQNHTSRFEYNRMYVITEAGGGKITFRQQPRTQGQDAALLPDIIPYHTIVNPYATGPIWINAARHAGTKIKSLTQSSGIASSIGAFFSLAIYSPPSSCNVSTGYCCGEVGPDVQPLIKEGVVGHQR